MATTPKKTSTKASTAKEAVELKISPIGDFKKRLGGITELPSGLVVRLHNPGGLNAFMGSSTIPNGLMPLVSKQIKNAKAGKGVDEVALGKEIEANPELMLQMTQMIDAIVIRCVVEPEVQPVPDDFGARNPDVLYVDELMGDDKQFIFKWLTSGVTDLEPFRK